MDALYYCYYCLVLTTEEHPLVGDYSCEISDDCNNICDICKKEKENYTELFTFEDRAICTDCYVEKGGSFHDYSLEDKGNGESYVKYWCAACLVEFGFYRLGDETLPCNKCSKEYQTSAGKLIPIGYNRYVCVDCDPVQARYTYCGNH